MGQIGRILSQKHSRLCITTSLDLPDKARQVKAAHVVRGIKMIPAMILIFTAPLVIMAMLTFDQLVIIEKEQFPEQWRNDGSPATFYRQRSQFKKGIKESFATNKCSLIWLFATPQWIKGNKKRGQIYFSNCKLKYFIIQLVHAKNCKSCNC